MASKSNTMTSGVLFVWLCLGLGLGLGLAWSSAEVPDPVPTPWPHQFHSILVMIANGTLQIIDLWYDWPNGRNFNIIQHQLGYVLYDLEWNNGTSFFYTLDSDRKCSSAQLEVGILRPNWLDGANYLGQRHADGFVCNVWEKVEFLTYYEDVLTKRPVLWVFYTGREAHVMTFEVGAVLEDAKWQAPPYCFNSATNHRQHRDLQPHFLPEFSMIHRSDSASASFLPEFSMIHSSDSASASSSG
ncbi:transferase [Parasponia andersonii]|uniref:Transferase n=1 Tax=Parasponia andersonii TaxID=3476 RepID=A0A2P5D549_PARAD|nr:transferase [Parasponia andersonii]